MSSSSSSSFSLSLDCYGLPRSIRHQLHQAGFNSVQTITQLRPTQLAHELGCTPALALTILNELKGQPSKGAPVPLTQEKAETNDTNNVSDTDQKRAAVDEKKTMSANGAKPTAPIMPHAAHQKEANKLGESALELMRRRSTLKPIVSLCEQLDTLMGGGIPIGQITEFCGVPGAGKCWGKDTAFMMFDGTTKLVQSIQEGDQLMGDDGTPRTVQPGSLTRGNTANDQPTPITRVMPIKRGHTIAFGHDEESNFQSSPIHGRYQCRYDGCDAVFATASECSAHEQLLRLHTLTHFSKPSTYQVTSLDPARDSWTCNDEHILVLKFNDKPSTVHYQPGSMKPYFFHQLTVNELNMVVEVIHRYTTESEAQFACELARIEWQPIVWEGSVNHFLQFSPTIQSKAVMFQPDSLTFHSDAKSLQFRLSNAIGRNVASHEVELTAWALGLYLNNPSSLSHQAIVDKLKQLHSMATKLDGDEKKTESHAYDNGKFPTTSVDSVLTCILQSYGISLQQPQLSHHFLSEPIHVRLSLLAGIIDGDNNSSIDSLRRSIQVTSQSRTFLDGFIQFVRGLGFSITSIDEKELCIHTATPKSETIFRMDIDGHDLHRIPTVLESKRMAFSDQSSAFISMDDGRCFGFKIEKVDHADYYGFTLDGNGRCVLRDFTVTHNTQLCTQLAVNVQMPKRIIQGAWEGEAIYIDTEGSFMAQRALSIAEGTVSYIRQRYDELTQRAAKAGKSHTLPTPPTAEDLLKGIHVYRAYDHIEQLAIMKALPAFLRQRPNVHLIIIDSIAFHFRRGFTDMGLRSRILTGMAQELLHLANQHQLAIVVSNQVGTRLDHDGPSGSAFGNSSLAPVLGESWSHACTNRLMLDWEGNGRVARLIKSPTMKADTIRYDITHYGVRNMGQQQQQQPHQPKQQQQQSQHLSQQRPQQHRSQQAPQQQMASQQSQFPQQQQQAQQFPQRSSPQPSNPSIQSRHIPQQQQQQPNQFNASQSPHQPVQRSQPLSSPTMQQQHQQYQPHQQQQQQQSTPSTHAGEKRRYGM